MTEQIDWLDLLEETRPEYLARARKAALELLETRETITINDVRAVCPPPKQFDGRVMGAVLTTSDFEGTGEYVKSSRDTCHKRPIQLFRRADG